MKTIRSNDGIQFIVDILLFLLHYRQNIQKGSCFPLVDQDASSAFSLVIEKEDFHLFNIIPLRREFFNDLQKLYSCSMIIEWKEIINIIDASLSTRPLNNAYIEVTTSYALLSIGFNELRKKYQSYRTENYGALSFAPQIEKLIDERSCFEFKNNPDYQGEILKCDTLKTSEEEKFEPDLSPQNIESNDLFDNIDEMF